MPQSKIVPIRPLARTRQSSRDLASERLCAALDASGLSQEQAAGLLGVHPRQVRRWLYGEVPLGPLELLVEIEAVTTGKRRAA